MVVVGVAPVAGAIAQEGQPADARPPAPAGAMAAWQEVEAWIRAWKLPSDGGGFPAAAACVTLRLGGDVIGRGDDYRADDRSVWRAAMEAMEEAAANVIESGGVANDAFRNEHLRLVAERMTLSVELAAALTPFSPSTYAEAEATLSPGVEGVAVRVGEEVYGLFPGAMTSANMLPHEALANRAAAAVGNAAAGLEEPGALAERHKLVFYRFETIHLAQTAPAQPPIFLHRGGRLVLREQITLSELQRMGGSMAAHLAGRIGEVEKEGVIREGYRPWLDRYEADERGQTLLLAGIALQRWRQVTSSDDQAVGEAIAAARAAAMEVSTRFPVEQADVLPLAFAVVLVSRDSGSLEEEASRAWLADAAVALASLHDEAGGFASKVREHERAPVAWALAEAAAALEADGALLEEAARSAVRRIYRETPEGRLVQHMPWLGWAEVRLAGFEAEGEVAAATALRRMRDHVWAHQLGPLDVDASGQDVVGGIVFTASDNPLPDWHTLRPVAFIATMLGDPRLTDRPERSAELARLLTSLRFLRQLQADESHLWMFRDADAAAGGVRAALWDQRMPADATSLGLLTAAETVASIRSLSDPR